ncbi:DNA-3-methyladenine glycosylase I [Microbacterium tumbae]
MTRMEQMPDAGFDVDDGTCGWANGTAEMRAYHDTEWGVPSSDDRHLFEMLTLEGAQAGLSWLTVLRRRSGYKSVFADFDAAELVAWGDDRLLALMQDERIIRNRAKILSVRTNAQALLRLREESGSFSDYLWDRVGGAPIVNSPRTLADLVPSSALSDSISKDLKKRGFSFVGTTIVYAFLEAVGIVDDHLVDCPRKRTSKGESR